MTSKLSTLAGACTLVVLTWCAIATSFAQNQPPADPQVSGEGMEIQARGQIHEAFASPSQPRPSASPVIQRQPPDPINELAPEQKPAGENVQWIPGYWMWDEEKSDYLWVSGTWRAVPPEKRWLPGYWTEAQGGWQWVSGYWTADSENQVDLLPAPPEPVEEAVPTSTRIDQTFVPGIWVYRQNQYWWRPGFWVTHHPGWVWIPASYCWTPAGYIFTDGYWDYDLARRGLAFAPVHFTAGIYTRPNWFYRPRFTISVDFLYGSLFVRLGWGHYYFGDYYDRRYLQLGFSPWNRFRYHDRFHDPLFAYYRWRHRDDPRWERDIQNVFVSRTEGTMARPGRTLAQVQRPGSSKDQPSSATDRAIVSIDQVKSDQMQLQRTTPGDERRAVEAVRTLGVERRRNESARRSSLYPRDPEPGKRVEPGRERLPGTKGTPPPGKQEPPLPGKVVPPSSKDPGKTQPPVEKGGRPPGKDTPDEVNQPPGKGGARYELPKSDRTVRPRGERPPPERPTPPPPVQRPPGKGGSDTPKRPDKPGKPGI